MDTETVFYPRTTPPPTTINQVTPAPPSLSPSPPEYSQFDPEAKGHELPPPYASVVNENSANTVPGLFIPRYHGSQFEGQGQGQGQELCQGHCHCPHARQAWTTDVSRNAITHAHCGHYTHSISTTTGYPSHRSIPRDSQFLDQPHHDYIMCLSVFVLLCCCVPFGMVAIVKSMEMKARHRAGDTVGERNAATAARMWAGSGILVGSLMQFSIIVWVVYSRAVIDQSGKG